jgi:hypothetical protein
MMEPLALKEIFIANSRNLLINKAKNSKCLSKEQWDRIVSRLCEIEGGEKKTLSDYNLLNSYQLLESNDVKVLISKKSQKQIVPIEDIFEILQSAHTTTGHGGRDTMLRRLLLKKSVSFLRARSYDPSKHF